MSGLEGLIKAYLRRDSPDLIELGTAIGKLYTDMGFPVDMSIERLREHYTEDQMFMIIHGACMWFIEHKRLSGAPEKAIERQRGVNRSILTNFVKGKETGIY